MTDDVVIRSADNCAVREYEWGSVESVASLVVETVAEFSGKEPTELERLYARIDTDALDRLFRPLAEGGSRTGGNVEFPFDDYVVSVHADGRIVVEPSRDG